jgi:hypothetical protein
MDIDKEDIVESGGTSQGLKDDIELDVSFLSKEQIRVYLNTSHAVECYRLFYILKANTEAIETQFIQSIEKISSDIEKMSPDMKSIQR